MDDIEDAKLVCESRQGNRESFERLLNRYEKPIFNAAYRVLHDYEDAKDVTQNVFLKAFENLEHFDSKYRFFSWIYRIAVNESINLCKSRRRLGAAEDTRVEERNTPENLLSRREQSGVVQAALMSLGFEYRMVIVLRHFNECSYREMSEILEISEKTVKSRLFTARGLLREILSEKGIL
jgi:RNA polymerase sigma-70 factor, ECF subfamily